MHFQLPTTFQIKLESKFKLETEISQEHGVFRGSTLRGYSPVDKLLNYCHLYPIPLNLGFRILSLLFACVLHIIISDAFVCLMVTDCFIDLYCLGADSF